MTSENTRIPDHEQQTSILEDKTLREITESRLVQLFTALASDQPFIETTTRNDGFRTLQFAEIIESETTSLASARAAVVKPEFRDLLQKLLVQEEVSVEQTFIYSPTKKGSPEFYLAPTQVTTRDVAYSTVHNDSDIHAIFSYFISENLDVTDRIPKNILSETKHNYEAKLCELRQSAADIGITHENRMHPLILALIRNVMETEGVDATEVDILNFLIVFKEINPWMMGMDWVRYENGVCKVKSAYWRNQLEPALFDWIKSQETPEIDR